MLCTGQILDAQSLSNHAGRRLTVRFFASSAVNTRKTSLTVTVETDANLLDVLVNAAVAMKPLKSATLYRRIRAVDQRAACEDLVDSPPGVSRCGSV